MRILIVEDQRLIAQRIERFVREILGDKLDYLKKIDNLDDAEEWLYSSVIDVLLLDLNLHNQSGFDLLKNTASGAFQTIIISAHKDKALEAFEYGVVDFVGKPFDLERLNRAFERLNLRNKQAGTRFLTVRKTSEIEIIPLEKLIFVKGAGAYSELHLDDGTKHIHDKTLEKLLNILPQNFERIHKSYIVDIKRVTRLIRKSGSYYELELSTNTKLPVGRTRIKAIKQLLSQ